MCSGVHRIEFFVLRVVGEKEGAGRERKMVRGIRNKTHVIYTAGNVAPIFQVNK